MERDLRVRYRLTATLKGGTGSGIGKRAMNVAHLLTEAAKDRPHHTALLFRRPPFTFEELDRLTDRAASALTGLEAGRGEVVAIFLDSGPELLVGYLGALRAGAVPNVVNAALQPEEVRHVVTDSGARVLITDPDRWAALGPVRDGLGVRHVLLTGGEPAAGAYSFDAVLAAASDRFATLDLNPGALASLLYTSGTTGHPKGVMLTHRNIRDNSCQLRVHYAADDRLLIAAPLFHCWGLINGVLGIFAVGGTAILIRRFRIEPVLDLIESAHPTILMAVPTMVNYLAKSPTIARRELSSLRVVLSAAAPMPLELIEVLRHGWGVGYAESYGLTETSPVITTTTVDGPAHAAGRWATPDSRWPTPSATPCRSARSASSGPRERRSRPATTAGPMRPHGSSRPTAGSTPATSSGWTRRVMSTSSIGPRT